MDTYSHKVTHILHGDINYGCMSLTVRDFYLGLSIMSLLPFSTDFVVVLPLLTGWDRTKSVVLVKSIPEAFAVLEFTPVVITHSRGLTKINT